MTFTLFMVVGALLALWVTILVISRKSGIARAAFILALGLAAFCGFGSLASFELPASQRWPWQLAYAATGLGSLVTALFGFAGALKRIKTSRSPR